MRDLKPHTTAKAVLEKISVRPVPTGGIRLTAVEADVLAETFENILRKRKRRDGVLTPEYRELLRVAVDNRARVMNNKERRRVSVERAA